MTADEDEIWNALESGLGVVTTRNPAALRALLADFEVLLRTDPLLADVRFDDAAFVETIEESFQRLGRAKGTRARHRIFELVMKKLGDDRTVRRLRGQLAHVVTGAGLGQSNRKAVAAALVSLAPALERRLQPFGESPVFEIVFNVQLDGWLERRTARLGPTDEMARRFATTGVAVRTPPSRREPGIGAPPMVSVDRTFSVPYDYRLEAVRRARLGRPVSATLRKARRVIESRGWAPLRAHEFKSAVRLWGSVDVLTAIQIAAKGDPSARLGLPDYYALLAPIASVTPSALTTWELQPGLEEQAVLAMMDTAIAFAIQAECSQDIEDVTRAHSKRGSN